MWGISYGTLGCVSDMEKKFWKRGRRGNLDSIMGGEASYGRKTFSEGCSDPGGHDQILLNVKWQLKNTILSYKQFTKEKSFIKIEKINF